MAHKWTADVTNDPSRDFALCIDISLEGEHRATILRSADGELVLRWHADEKDADVPVTWLVEILQRAQRDMD